MNVLVNVIEMSLKAVIVKSAEHLASRNSKSTLLFTKSGSITLVT